MFHTVHIQMSLGQTIRAQMSLGGKGGSVRD
jgi:hypothetical protein